jgi:hypothetical protein
LRCPGIINTAMMTIPANFINLVAFIVMVL